MDDAPWSRLAETLAALSIVTDAAIGYPSETAVRATLVATRLAEELGVGPQERSRIYYTTLLRYVGCTAGAHEAVVHLSDDDIHVNHRLSLVDAGRPVEAMTAVFSVLGRGRPPLERARRVASFAVHGTALSHEVDTSHCEVATRLAARFGLDREVATALYQITERWDGKGAPRKLRGDAIGLPTRYAVLAHIVAGAANHEDALDPAAVVRRMSGTLLDPALATAFAARADSLLEEIAQPDAWERALAVEPPPHVTVPAARVEDVARGFADAVDLKSPFLQGHSAAVAALADGAAGVLGKSDEERRRVRCAGLLHDLGRVGVPTGVWEKPGPLSVSERDQVQAHTYLTERILCRAPALAPLAALAAAHHERLDGSGYHRGASAPMLDPLARVLAAADVYRALCEDRPHRPAFTASGAAAEVEAMVGRGLLDGAAAAAVCEAAGVRRRRTRPAYPAGLTEREVEVLRLLAKGLTKKQIAAQLVVSAATVHTHTVHIYEKSGVTTRAGVALFAMENDLLDR